jgi:hypothetical protein
MCSIKVAKTIGAISATPATEKRGAVKFGIMNQGAAAIASKSTRFTTKADPYPTAIEIKIASCPTKPLTKIVISAATNNTSKERDVVVKAISAAVGIRENPINMIIVPVI